MQMGTMSNTDSSAVRRRQPHWALALRRQSTSSTSDIARGSFSRSNARPATLPKIKDQRFIFLGAAVFAITAWSFFVAWAMSAEKAASSVVRTIAFNLRSSPLVKEALGDGVKLKPFLLGTEPWIHGTVNTIQGIVDINFRIESASGRQGTVYFKSQRKHKAGRFETANFTLFVDGNPTPIDLMHTDLLQLGN